MSDFCHAIYAGDVRCSKYKLLHGNYHMSVSGFVWTDKHPESPIEPDLAALEAQFREKAMTIASEIVWQAERGTWSGPRITVDEARAIFALHAEIEKRKGRE